MNIIIYGLGEYSAKLLAFFSIVLLARGLGPEKFGTLTFAESFIAYFLYFQTFGMDSIAAQKTSINPKEISKYIGILTFTKLIIFPILLFTISILAFSLVKQTEVAILIALYGLTFLPIALSLEWVFQVLKKSSFLGLNKLIREGLFLLSIIFLLKYSKNLLVYPLARTASMLFPVLLFWLLVIFWQKIKIFFKISFAQIKYMIKLASPIMGGQFIAIFVYNMAQVLLGLFFDKKEVGYFSSVSKVILVLMSIYTLLMTALFPYIANWFKHLKDSFKERMLLLTTGFSSISATIAIIGVVFAPHIVHLLYGENYIKSIPIMRILSLAFFFVSFSIGFSGTLIACGFQKQFFKLSKLQFISYVLSLPLILKFHSTGAAVSWLIFEAAGALLFSLYFRRNFDLKIFKIFCRSFLYLLIGTLLMWRISIIGNSFLLIIGFIFLILGGLILCFPIIKYLYINQINKFN